MTTVGYGGVIATTPRGRQLALISVAVGAFLLSVLVAIITEWFILSEKQDNAITKIRTDKKAVRAVKAAFKFNVARGKRYRLLTDGNEEGEHIPTQEDLLELRKQMQDAAMAFRNQRLKDSESESLIQRDNELKLVRD